MKTRKRHLKRWIALPALALIAVAYLIIDNSVRPTILSLSESRLRALAVQAMNESVRENIGSQVSYSDLIEIQKDNEGNIILVNANAAVMNNLAAATAITAQEKIQNLGKQGISIPIGTIIGGQLLSGRGPSIVVQFEPVGSITTNFKTDFEDAGINQTRLKIYLILDTTLRIVVSSTSQTVEISSQVLVSETIIVGDVPQSYVNVDNTDDMLNLLPDSMMQP